MSALRDLVARLGGRLYGPDRAAVPGPGHGKSDLSLSLYMLGDRLIWHSFAGDAPELVWSYLETDARPMTDVERRRAAREREAEDRARRERNAAFCGEIWRGSRSLAASPALAYLRGARGLRLDVPPDDLRYVAACPRGYHPSAARAPALVGLVRAPDGRPAGLHATFIRPDGAGKAFGDRSRVMFGSVVGGAVRLMPIGQTLAVGEGVETALAFAHLHRLPVWACLSTAGLRRFAVPPGLRRLVVAADHDKAGLDAARELAERAAKLCAVTIAAPAAQGHDWADALTEQRAAA